MIFQILCDLDDDYIASLKDRFLSKVDQSSHCWTWTGPKNKKGYGRIGIGHKNHGAHRVSYELFKGPIPKDAVIRHGCDNPSCVNPDHLKPGTQHQNIWDMMQRKGKDQTPGNAKLLDRQVVEIRNSFKNEPGEIARIAKAHKMHPTAIQKLLRGKTYSHLPGKLHPEIERVFSYGPEIVSKVLRLYKPNTFGMNRVAEELGIGRGTVERIIKGQHHTQA